MNKPCSFDIKYNTISFKEKHSYKKLYTLLKESMLPLITLDYL